MMRNLTCLALWLAMVVPAVRADEVHLRNGQVLEGRVVSQTDERLVLRRVYGEITFSSSQVVKVVSSPSVFDEYDQRRRALKNGDIAQRLELAAWCKKEKLRREMRILAEEVVALDSGNLQARRLLGHRLVRGQWLPEASAMKKLGFVRRKGRWMSPQEVKAERAARHAKLRLVKLERRVNRLVGRVFSLSAKRSAKARDDLIALAKKERVKGLAAAARDLFRQADAWRQAVATARVDVRADTVSITGFRELSLGLANGSARVQLPSTRRTSIRTGVVAPAGR
jgi:hypothetical protein